MICRTCRLLPRATARLALPLPLSRRALSTTPQTLNAAAAAAAPDLTPLTPSPTDAESADAPPALSSCLPGTKLNGLNYIKGREDPVALADDAYPAWLWDCLTVMKKAEDANAGADDEFSKSKKTRRLAKKRRLAAEATLLATGDLQALVPKIPLGKQSINLPGGEGEGLEGAVQAAEAREDLRRALRKERKKGIKESNYLKTM